MGTVSEHLKIHLCRVSSLNLVVDTVQLPPKPVFRCGVEHLRTDSSGRRGPCDEEDLALLTVLRSYEIKVIYGISTIIIRQSCHKIIIALRRTTNLFNYNLSLLLINLEYHIAVKLLPLQLHESVLALIRNPHGT